MSCGWPARSVAHVASSAAGCRYCQAHTAAHAARHGAPSEKALGVVGFEVGKHAG